MTNPPAPMPPEVAAAIRDLRLVDHHCHGVVTKSLDRAGFEELATESDRPLPTGATAFDSQVGVVMRAECAPLLDLPRHAPPEDYVARRRELGPDEVNRRLLRATGIETYGVDGGFQADVVCSPQTLADLGGGRAREVIRLEYVAERIAASGVSAADYPSAVAAEIARLADDALGVKSIVAYRFGLDFDPTRPTGTQVRAAAGRWFSRAGTRRRKLRIADPVLLRHLLWTAVDLAVPIQLHIGYGDSDIVMHRCNPALLTDFIRSTQNTGAQVMLLHCWPYHREAGYLAQIYPHVWVDTGAALGFSGLGSPAVLRESLEMAPFGKVLFSTDAFGLAELYVCGSVLWRRGLARVLGEWVAEDWMSATDAVRLATMIGRDNAARAYGSRLEVA